MVDWQWDNYPLKTSAITGDCTSFNNEQNLKLFSESIPTKKTMQGGCNSYFVWKGSKK